MLNSSPSTDISRASSAKRVRKCGVYMSRMKSAPEWRIRVALARQLSQ